MGFAIVRQFLRVLCGRFGVGRGREICILDILIIRRPDHNSVDTCLSWDKFVVPFLVTTIAQSTNRPTDLTDLFNRFFENKTEEKDKIRFGFLLILSYLPKILRAREV